MTADLTRCTIEWHKSRVTETSDFGKICTMALAYLDTQPPKAAAPVDANGDWPEDFSHENGNYFCLCAVCKKQFTGHKRRVVCKLCTNTPEPKAPVDDNGPKGCPFCDGKASTPYFSEKYKGFVVDCVNIDCRVNPITPPCGCKEAAIEAWNTRPDSREPKAMLDEMAEEFLEGDKFFKLGYALGKKDALQSNDRNVKAMRNAGYWSDELDKCVEQSDGVNSAYLNSDVADPIIRAIQQDALQSGGCALPEGWIAVPKKCTQGMVDASLATQDIYTGRGALAALGYEAMLAAAHKLTNGCALPEWQPIETAPKDGTKFDGWHKHMGRITDCEYKEGRRIVKKHGHPEVISMVAYATHWMPLPAAPQPPKD